MLFFTIYYKKQKNKQRFDIMKIFMSIFKAVYGFLWGDLVTIPLPGGNSLGLSLMVLMLIPTGIYFTLRTRFMPVRLFPQMVRITLEKQSGEGKGLSGLQSLMVSTATRVGMGNLVGVVAAVSAGGAGAVFWMWITALIGSATAYIEATLAQQHKEKDPLYGGWRGGPAYYIHDFVVEKTGGKKRRHTLMAVLFAISGLICWCGISQVISNSVSSAFESAFSVPPIVSTVILVAVSAVIVLRKNATVKVLDVVVPVMAGCYLLLTLAVILMNIGQLPAVFARIFAEAFGLRQMAAGGFGAVVMNGVKRGLFSNEAGSGSAPCSAAAAETDHPAKVGLLQSFGVFIDTIVICSCTAWSLPKHWPVCKACPCCRPLWNTTSASSARCSSWRCCGCSAFPPFWACCFTPAPMWPTCLAITGFPKRRTKCWRWSCFLWAAWQPTPSCGI